jgi:hypothetical protein
MGGGGRAFSRQAGPQIIQMMIEAGFKVSIDVFRIGVVTSREVSPACDGHGCGELPSHGRVCGPDLPTGMSVGSYLPTGMVVGRYLPTGMAVGSYLPTGIIGWLCGATSPHPCRWNVASPGRVLRELPPHGHGRLDPFPHRHCHGGLALHGHSRVDISPQVCHTV